MIAEGYESVVAVNDHGLLDQLGLVTAVLLGILHGVSPVRLMNSLTKKRARRESNPPTSHKRWTVLLSGQPL